MAKRSNINPRTLEAEWVREIRDRCQANSTPLYFKQWGVAAQVADHAAHHGGKSLDGQDWLQFPAVEHPAVPTSIPPLMGSEGVPDAAFESDRQIDVVSEESEGQGEPVADYEEVVDAAIAALRACVTKEQDHEATFIPLLEQTYALWFLATTDEEAAEKFKAECEANDIKQHWKARKWIQPLRLIQTRFRQETGQRVSRQVVNRNNWMARALDALQEDLRGNHGGDDPPPRPGLLAEAVSRFGSVSKAAQAAPSVERKAEPVLDPAEQRERLIAKVKIPRAVRELLVDLTLTADLDPDGPETPVLALLTLQAGEVVAARVVSESTGEEQSVEITSEEQEDREPQTGEAVPSPAEDYTRANLGLWLIGNPTELPGRIARRDNPDGTVSLRWEYMATFGDFDPYRAAKNAKGEWHGSERVWNLKRSSADRICRLAEENGAKIVSLDVTDWSALVVQVRPLISRTDQTPVEWTLEVDLEASRASLGGDLRPLREFVQGRWVPSRIIWAEVVRDGHACGRLVTGPLTADAVEAIRSALAERGVVVHDGPPCGVSDQTAIATRDDIGLSVNVEVDAADRRTLVFASERDGTWTGRIRIGARSWPPLRDRLQAAGFTVEERGWTPRPLPTVDWSVIEGWDRQVNGRTLRPYQRAGVKFVLGHNLRAVIGDDMGTGKTAQAVVAVHAAGCKRVAVICPKNAVSVWRREIRAWRPDLPEIVVVEGATEVPTLPETGWIIVTYETLTPRIEQIQLNVGYQSDQLAEIRDAFVGVGGSKALRVDCGDDGKTLKSIRITLDPDHEDILDAIEVAVLPTYFRESQRLRDALTRARGTLRAALLDWNPDAVLMDEAHRIKNPKAARTRTVRALVADQDRGAVLLTGTPLRNRSEEALTLLEALIPVDEYRTVANRTGISKAELAAFLLDRYMIRRTKAEVLPELPPKIRQRVDIGLTDKAQEEYLGEYRDAMQAAQDRYFQALVETRSRAKAAEAALGMWSAARRLLGLAKVAGGIVADLVAGIVEERGACIAFAHHRDVLDMLRRQIEAAGLRVVQVDGDTPISDREAAERAFQAGELDVFLGGITAAGESITLTRSDTCVFGELDWVPANLLQAEDRGHRLGQTANGYHVLTCMADFDLDPMDDMDALMWSMLGRKLWEINEVLGESTTLEAAEPQAGESVRAILEARAWERAANRMRTEGLADLIDGVN